MKINSPLKDLFPGKIIANHSSRKEAEKWISSQAPDKNITDNASEKGLDVYDSGDKHEQRILSNVISQARIQPRM